MYLTCEMIVVRHAGPLSRGSELGVAIRCQPVAEPLQQMSCSRTTTVDSRAADSGSEGGRLAWTHEPSHAAGCSGPYAGPARHRGERPPDVRGARTGDQLRMLPPKARPRCRAGRAW